MSYISLANITLSSAQSSVTFGSIPTSVNGVALRDLIVVVNGTGTGTMTFGVQFNGDTANNYTYVEMNGNSAGAESSASSLSQALIGRFTTNNGAAIGQIMDYSATDKHKTVLARGGQAGDLVRASASRWANNNAINAVRVVPLSNQFATGTTFALYGIAG